MKTSSFSVNQYDSDGDIIDECVLIHMNNNTILRFSSLEYYVDFIDRLTEMKKEIIETWNECNK